MEVALLFFTPETTTGKNQSCLFIFSINSFKWSFCVVPTWRSTTSPFFKNTTVGMFIIPKCSQQSGFSSTSHLRISTTPSYSEASSSTIGDIFRHGPHHSAQKSTTTRESDANTSCKSLSVNSFCHFMIFFILLWTKIVKVERRRKRIHSFFFCRDASCLIQRFRKSSGKTIKLV